VVEVFIPRATAGDTAGLGKVFVEFANTMAASLAARGLGGRSFDGRSIRTAFLDEAKFDDGLLDDHPPPI